MTVAALSWLVVFCVSFGVALFAFLGYPLLMLIVARKKSPRGPTSDGSRQLPHVAMVVAAYNEAASIIATLKTLVQQEYPSDRYEIIVFSDGSTDGTDQLVQSFAASRPIGSPTVRLIRFEGRIGKTECQNRVVEQRMAQSGPAVIAFSDGNILWQPQALVRLVEPFEDARVGATTGALLLVRPSSETMTLERTNEGLFRRFDHAIKKGESALLSTVGVNGPIYAVRGVDYIRLQPHLVSDLVLPVLLVACGRQVRYVPESIGLEPASSSIWQEFKRKRRLVVQGFVALPLLLRAAHPVRRPALFALLVSHKVLRWVGVELLAISFVATLALVLIASPVQPIFAIAAIIEVAALLLAGLGLLFTDSSRGRPAIIEALSFFVLTNVASLVAVVDYVRGETATRWHTQRTAK